MELALSLAIVFATLLGPVLAVWVTRRIDWSRQRRERQMDIFRALMATRRVPLSPEKVRALNMVEIDFHGVPPVLRAFAEVMTHINTQDVGSVVWLDRHRSLMTRLLSEMAQLLGYRLAQLDMLEGGYYPKAFADTEKEQQAVRQALVQILSGRRPLLVAQAAATPQEPFPPPPRPGVS